MQQVIKVMDNKYDFRLNMVRHAMKYSVSDAAYVYGRTRKTVRKWCYRFGKEDLSGLEDRSRCPYHSPNRTSVMSCLYCRIISCKLLHEIKRSKHDKIRCYINRAGT